MPAIPERLQAALADRYHLEREVGQGGMATVYLAQDLKHHRRVALKVLRPELAAALGPERFVREVETVAQLQHPHILPLFDSGEADGFLYYVMPFVDGESLRERLKREGDIPIHEAVRILREVVDALAHAHQHGIVHRDIKPDNVMLSGRHAVVTDFGVAKAVSAAGTDKLTTVGVALGTPTYMAPEQAMGETNLDASGRHLLRRRAGVRAADRLPRRSSKPTAQALLSAHVLEKPTPPETRRAGIAPALVRAGDALPREGEGAAVADGGGDAAGARDAGHTERRSHADPHPAAAAEHRPAEPEGADARLGAAGGGPGGRGRRRVDAVRPGRRAAAAGSTRSPCCRSRTSPARTRSSWRRCTTR